MSKTYPTIDFSKIELHDGQREIYNSDAQFCVVACGRQWGKSTLARIMLLEKAANEGKQCIWLAPVTDQTTTHWTYLVQNLKKIKFPVEQISQQNREIYFYSGGSIVVRSTVLADNRRGRTLDFAVLDEAAFMHEEVWNIILPSLIVKQGRALLLSTPNGKNWFYDLYMKGLQKDQNIYKSWSMPTHTNPYINREFLEELRKGISARVWSQEYMADFNTSGGDVFVNYVENSVVEGYTQPKDNVMYTMGVDWGISKDYTAITIMDSDHLEQVAGYRFNSNSIDETLQFLLDLIYLWRPFIVNIELNGMGLPIFKMLKERLLSQKRVSINDEDSYLETVEFLLDTTKIRGINVSHHLKKEAIDRVVADLEFNRLKLLSSDKGAFVDYARVQMSEMSQFTVQKTPNGLVTYKATYGNDDTVIALMLCYMATNRYNKVKENAFSTKDYSRLFRATTGEGERHFKKGFKRHARY